MSIDFDKLKAPFPREAVHWRAQTLTKDGTKALALAYIDARNVMDRLDEVVGPENWQDDYTDKSNGRTLCRLGVKVGDEWVWKVDGAGDTQVEAEKGGISDSFKRAGVKWGIGRYLYALKSPWVPCKTYERGGKKYFSEFTADPWDFIDGKRTPTTTNGKANGTPPKGPVDQIADEEDDRKTILAQEAREAFCEKLRRAFPVLPEDQAKVICGAIVNDTKNPADLRALIMWFAKLIDEKNAWKVIRAASSFTTEDGDERAISGKAGLEKASDKWIGTTYGKLKTRLEETVDAILSPEPAGPDVGDGDNMPPY